MSKVLPREAQYAAIEAERKDLPTPPLPLATQSEAARTTSPVHVADTLASTDREDPSLGARPRLNSFRAWFQSKG